MRTGTAALGAGSTALLLSAARAPGRTSGGETPVSCGQVVTGTIKVANDLVCPDTDGLIVGADNTVIDLNGHRISCRGEGLRGKLPGRSTSRRRRSPRSLAAGGGLSGLGGPPLGRRSSRSR